MSQNCFYLLKDMDPALDYRDKNLVSASLEVSYELTRRGIRYQILEDFYKERELKKGERDYFFDQLKWMEGFDGWLKERIGYCKRYNLNLVKAHYQRFKYFCDTVILQSGVLHALIERIGREKGSVTYVQKKSVRPKDPTLQQFRLRERDILFDLMLPEVCQKFSVPLNFHEYGTGSAPPECTPCLRRESGLNQLKQKGKQWLKDGFLTLKYKKAPSPESVPSAEHFHVFFPHLGGEHLDPVIKDFISRRARVYSTSDEKVICLNNVFQKPLAYISEERGGPEETQIKEECRQAAREFENSAQELIEWISSRCGINAGPIVAPYFRTFIENTCYEILRKTRNFHDFFTAQQIHYVISHTNSDSLSKSAFLAAGTLPEIKKVGIQHGSHVFDDLTWPVHDLDVFDYYFTTDGVSETLHAKGARLDYISPVKVFQSSHYLESGRDRFLRRRGKQKEGQGGKLKNVLYIPTVLGGHLRLFNCVLYPALWYFEFQKSLLEHFAKKEGQCRFIYKHAKTITGMGEDSIIPYLRERKFKNISVVTTRVMESLEKVDAVILDRPSTAFFEVNACALPALAICPDFSEPLFDQEIVGRYGKSIQTFSDFSEAFSRIDEFLVSDGTQYIHPLPLAGNRLSQTLIELSQAERPGSFVLR